MSGIITGKHVSGQNYLTFSVDVTSEQRGGSASGMLTVLTFGSMMVEDDNRLAKGLVSLSSLWDRDGEVSLDMIWTCVTGFSSILISSTSSTLCSTGIRSASFFVDACCSRLFDARRLRDSLTIRSGDGENPSSGIVAFGPYPG